MQESGADWETLDTFWISDGGHEQTRVRVEIKLRLEELTDEI